MKKVLLFTIVASALLGFGLQAAETSKEASQVQRPLMHKTDKGIRYYSKSKEQAKAYVARELERHHDAMMQKVPKELLQAFGETYKALKLIQMGQNDQALKLLEKADKAFDTVLKKHPKLKMVPLNERIFVSELIAKPEEIKRAVDYDRELLKGYHTQAASGLLATLRDEIDIATSYLPTELYPKSIKEAIAALKKKDLKGAVAALGAGFGTIVTVETAVPLPLLAAQDLVIQASKVDKKKKDQIEKLLKAAKEELQKAYYLGYTDLHPAAYNDLMKQIQGIEKEMGGKNMVEKLYDKLKASFAKLVGKTYHDSVERKEAQALKNPASVQGEKSAQAKVEEAQSKELFEAKMKAVDFEKESKKEAQEGIKK